MGSQRWVEAAGLKELEAAHGLLEVVIENRLVLLVLDQQRVHATAALCTHEFAPLREGVVTNGRLECPRHRARFCLQDGTPDSGWQIAALRLYPVRVAGTQVEVDAAAFTSTQGEPGES